MFTSMLRTGSAGGRGRGRVGLRLAAPFVAILVLVASTAGFGGSPEDVGVDEARERWDATGIDDYVITYRHGQLGEATVTFVDGVVADYRTDVPRLEDATIHWVDTLFDEIDRVADAEGGDVTSVTFHPDLGYPVEAILDPDRTVAGDEWSFEVITLTPR